MKGVLPAGGTSFSSIKLIIFDLDGTLIDAYPAITKSFNYVMAEFGYKPQNSSVIRKAVGWGDKSLLKPFVTIRDLNKALYVYRRHHAVSLVKYSSVFPKVYLLMSYLKDKGYKLAVASNRPTRFSWILLRHLKLKKYFDYVLCADKLRSGKPNPEIINKIMRRFKVIPFETMYVGDMPIDAQTGRRAGVKTIIVTSGSSTKKEIEAEKPGIILKNAVDLLKIL